MAVDLIDELVRLRQGYARTRGGTSGTGLRNRSTGRPLFVAGTIVPATTWGDVWVTYQHLLRFIDPTPEQCQEQVRSQYQNDPKYRADVDAWLAGGFRSFANAGPLWVCEQGPRTINPRGFVRTADFKRALVDFKAVNPADKLGAGVVGFANLLAKIPLNEVYPYNEEFWGHADDLVRERSAAGVVRTWREMAGESVKEAIQELPSTLKDVAAKVLSVVDPRNLVPDVRPWVDLIKWSAIAGGVFILGWYVVRPAYLKRQAQEKAQ